MTNALDYLKWRGDISFDAVPPNEVDMFLCSQIVTPDYAGIVPKDDASIPLPEAVEKYFSTHEDSLKTLGALQSKYVHPMLHALPECRRFAELRLSHYVNRIDRDASEQFCAVTILFPNGDVCVAYQGTDDTIVGWKEDFDLAVTDGVPSQKDAVTYLKAVAKSASPEAKIYVCGHSKGGNLAVYGAVSVPAAVRKSIAAVYSFDGPGFRDAFFENAGYLDLQDRITTVLSQHAIVGVMMKGAGTRRITVSTVSGPLAHDGFNWKVLGASFLTAPAFSRASRTFSRTLDEMMRELTEEEKSEFIRVFFDALFGTGAVTVSDLTHLSPKKVLSALSSLNKRTKPARLVRVALLAFFHAFSASSDKPTKSPKTKK